ncbi:hypothetical protein PR048_027005 [Dryococelus australis]|uniref:Uncharacterized protein n=1 Tax=Dryococelus australis TaxID=614101 RepID=A0ABQ9GMX0_9NEOP|nr:hypothetical protein PR048_027005 [Dryococelus australis]
MAKSQKLLSKTVPVWAGRISTMPWCKVEDTEQHVLLECGRIEDLKISLLVWLADYIVTWHFGWSTMARIFEEFSLLVRRRLGEFDTWMQDQDQSAVGLHSADDSNSDDYLSHGDWMRRWLFSWEPVIFFTERIAALYKTCMNHQCWQVTRNRIRYVEHQLECATIPDETILMVSGSVEGASENRKSEETSNSLWNQVIREEGILLFNL